LYFGVWSDRVSDFDLMGEPERIHPTLLPASDFVIDKYIGEGGMYVICPHLSCIAHTVCRGTVYGARVKQSGEKVALKIFGEGETMMI
jgi:hypothetical protein